MTPPKDVERSAAASSSGRDEWIRSKECAPDGDLGAPSRPDSSSAARDAELLNAIEKAHAWLERVEEYRTPTGGYIGLDHHLGQNVEGCTYCHAAAVLHGLAEPVLP